MNSFLEQILREAARGNASLDVKTKNSKVEIKNGKIIYTVEKIVVEMILPKPR